MGFVKIARHLSAIAIRNFKEKKKMSFLLIGLGATRQAWGTQQVKVKEKESTGTGLQFCCYWGQVFLGLTVYW